MNNHGFVHQDEDSDDSEFGLGVRILVKMPGYETMVNERDDDEVIIPTNQLVGHGTDLGSTDDFPSGEYTYRKWCGIRRSTWFLLLYSLTYVAYLVLGGIAMRMIEQERVDELTLEAKQNLQEFMDKYPEVKSKDLEALLEAYSDSISQGIDPLVTDDDEDNWSIGQSILFTVTVVTTIGYGHVTPLTAQGKMFTVVFAVFGIPFTLVFITAAVQRLLEPTCSILAYFFYKFGSKIRPIYIRLTHLFFMVFLVVSFFILLPSLAFYLIEPEWSFLDGFYFVFISLTTIGLGDYIPGDNQEAGPLKEFYKIAVAAYLLLGLVFITLAATVFSDIPQLNLGNVLLQQKDLTIAKTPSKPSSMTNEEQQQQEDQGSEGKSEKSLLRDSFWKVLGGGGKNSGKYTQNSESVEK